MNNSIPICSIPQSNYYETSHKQRRDWSYSQLLKGQYKIVIGEKIDELDIDLFKKAICVVLRSNESLRTNFVTIDGKLVQVIREYDHRYEIKYFDCRGVWGSIRYSGIVKREKKRRVDYQNEPLISSMLFRFNDGYRLMLFIEHIIFDAISNQILRSEIKNVYHRILNGQEILAIGKRFQLKDYVAWKNKRVDDFSNIVYWQQARSKSEYVLNFDKFYLNCGIQNFKKIKGVKGEFRGFISGELKNDIDEMTRQFESSRSFFMTTTFVLLMSFFFKKRSILVSTISMGRESREFVDLIACCAEPIFLFIDIDANLTVRDTIRMVERVFFSSAEHLFPWGDIREIPLNGMYLMQINYIPNLSKINNTSFKHIKSLHANEKSNVVMPYSFLQFTERFGYIELLFSYSREIYSPQMIQILFEQYLVLLNKIKQDSNSKISDLMKFFNPTP
jgi:hypothetical protein